MKKLKEVQILDDLFISKITELHEEMKIQYKKIKQEYQTNLINEKYKLLIEMCNGEGLDLEKMRKKYLKIESNLEFKNFNETVLDKIEINGNEYYYEAKEEGIIYNNKSNPIGIYRNGKFIIN